MKTREEFIKSVFAKAEKQKAEETAAAAAGIGAKSAPASRRKRFKIAGGIAAAAACVMIAVGSSGVLDEIIAGTFEPSGEFIAAPVVDAPYDANAGDVSENDMNAAENNNVNASGDVKETGEKAGNEAGDLTAEAPATHELCDDDWGAVPSKSITHSGAYDSYIYGGEQMQNVSVEIFKQAASSKKNSMVSPISVIMAMGMVENGAAGDTKTQMEKTFGMKTDDMNVWVKEWSAAQESKSDNRETKINIANAFWYNEAAGFKPDAAYKKLLKKSFDAEIKGGNFDDATVNQINKWVDKQTDGMIKKLVDRLNPSDMTVLANAVAFQDKWAEPYEKFQVKKENFTLENGKKKKMNMMYSTEDTYLSDKLATGFTKPYQSGYQFVAILPNEGISVKEYLAQMDGDSFAAFLNSGEEATVHAVMPSFKSEYSTDAMVSILKKMGIKDVFSSADADLSKMGMANGENLFVSDIIHKTFIEVDREGTKAAAVTGVFVKATSMPVPLNEYTVRLDRPYIYAIIDENTQIPVFMGTMVGV